MQMFDSGHHEHGVADVRAAIFRGIGEDPALHTSFCGFDSCVVTPKRHNEHEQYQQVALEFGSAPRC